MTELKRRSEADALRYVLQKIAEFPYVGEKAAQQMQLMAKGALAIDADAHAQRAPWQPMDVKPDRPMMADLFYRDLFFTDYKTSKKVSAVMERGRDERFGIGWWDGETWFHSGTAHELFENYSEYPKEQFPTHWRPLDVSALTSTELGCGDPSCKDPDCTYGK